MVENSISTFAYIGGESCRRVACLLSLPEGCNCIYIEGQTLVLVNRQSGWGLDWVNIVEQGLVNANLHFRPEVMARVGKPGILITMAGQIFYNEDWLGSEEFMQLIPNGRRRLLRWLACLPGNLSRGYSQN